LAVVNLSIHATLAVDYFAARTLDAEEKLLHDTVAQYEQALQLNEDRYRGGLGSEVEVEQARTILETTRAQLVDVGLARAQYEHATAVLIGKGSRGFHASAFAPHRSTTGDSGRNTFGITRAMP
jgi:outer membrane protein TolC